MKRRLIFMGSAALGAALGLIPAIGEGVGITIVFAIIGQRDRNGDCWSR